MVKGYYCDYCDKTMVASPSIIRTHVKGLAHQKLVAEHYQQYKDPATILYEEWGKKPCITYPRGECNFGSICKFSHYTQDEINALKLFVAERQKKRLELSCPSFEHLYQRLQDQRSETIPNTADDQNTVFYDNDGVTHVLPWSYNPVYDDFGLYLPESLKRLTINDLIKYFAEWG